MSNELIVEVFLCFEYERGWSRRYIWNNNARRTRYIVYQIFKTSKGVGKSAFTLQFIQQIFHPALDPNIEDYYTKKIKNQGKEITISILDAQSDSKKNKKKFFFLCCLKENSIFHFYKYSYGNGGLILYSVTDRSSFDLVEKEIKIVHQRHFVDFPIIVIGNKIDLENERNVSYDEGKELTDKYPNVLFFETSVKLNVNIDEVFYAIVGEINGLKQKYIDFEKAEKKNDCLMM